MPEVCWQETEAEHTAECVCVRVGGGGASREGKEIVSLAGNAPHFDVQRNRGRCVCLCVFSFARALIKDARRRHTQASFFFRISKASWAVSWRTDTPLCAGGACRAQAMCATRHIGMHIRPVRCGARRCQSACRSSLTLRKTRRTPPQEKLFKMQHVLLSL